MILSHALRAASSINIPSIIFNASYNSSSASATTITVTNVSFGSENPSRIVAITIGTVQTPDVTISSVTIGGVSATLAQRSAADNRSSAIYYASISTGTQGDVAVTFSSLNTNVGINIASFSIINATSATPRDSKLTQTVDATGVSPSLSATLSLPSNSVVLAIWSAGAVASGNASSWTNLTETTDDFVTPSAYSTATTEKSSSGNLTVTCTNSDSSVNRPILVAAAWR